MSPNDKDILCLQSIRYKMHFVDCGRCSVIRKQLNMVANNISGNTNMQTIIFVMKANTDIEIEIDSYLLQN